ncbi:NAD(P)/FAD-dependent oxidoreductase [Arundinibacter roseus]|uniref:NAD(P)/FAD-dependent oxidoreductase n=1 Tax=Arundinibacter roseus TaxID=2070510 RepID=A0A4R4KAB8_9BACT|nr:NAD(P)/FAD-dependent oxidoreductase [Arundinibacter roseus]TDB64543.1 NAD(P)/FAD-dependent oxidoreductase [Arundinibacter roseus]
MTYPLVIIGGGLAGLIAALEMARAGIRVLVIERKSYPHHKVCGEYISNEVRPYLHSLGFMPEEFSSAELTQFRFTSPKGSVLDHPLDLGGFGLSRYTMDEALYKLALRAGVEFLVNTSVTEVEFRDTFFEIKTSDNQAFRAQIVHGAFGKRTRLDKQLNRKFMAKESPYVGVKYHIRGNFDRQRISLHNFENGYCGMSAIEDDKFCLCYLTERNMVRKYGSISALETNILSQNPHLKNIFEEAEFLYQKPEVINEISFEPKSCVENHILMAGDSAGLITPLCGNGMAMAIRAAFLLSQELVRYFKVHHSRALLEKSYETAWQKEFSRRLTIGRTVQKLFGRKVLSELALHFFTLTPPLLHQVIKSTHGRVMSVPTIYTGS